MDPRNLPVETEAWHKKRLAQQNMQGLQKEIEVHGGTIDTANEARRDSGNSTLSKKDKELGGMTMEEFVRGKLAASLRIAPSAGGRDAIPTIVNGIWYPPAEYTNSFQSKSTERS